MMNVSQAEQVLLDQIRLGEEEAWSQLVNRYQGRLETFARARLGQKHDCEDIVQDTFIAFLRALPKFRGECNLETFLFTLLRRKIIDSYRRKAARHICLIQDVYNSHASDEKASDALDCFEAGSPAVSWYARNQEQTDRQHTALEQALYGLVNGYKKQLSLLELKVVEAIFYGHLSNADTAQLLGITANRVGVLKHRCIKQIRSHMDQTAMVIESDGTVLESMLTDIWQNSRLSCPKRSTVGAFLLDTLDKDWRDYVDFHLNTLGCHYCRANLEDLKRQNAENNSPRSLHVRIMESTIGFLNKPT
ncbi:MAG: sigma-70 family RNA polymerase sigma factor [Phycisphaeraceae bacterium]|nr:sigma-70 family RNA polymerase sigma factor [Phycisphaeraceae bacterium]